MGICTKFRPASLESRFKECFPVKEERGPSVDFFYYVFDKDGFTQDEAGNNEDYDQAAATAAYGSAFFNG